MDLQLKGKRVLVTGASQGLGKEAARMLAAEDCHVAILARREELLDELAAEIEKSGHRRSEVIKADITEPDAATRIRDTAFDKLGGVDILVNSAGGSRPTTWDAPEDFWEEGMLLNFTALRRLTTALIPGMQASGWGRVINLTGTVEPVQVNVAIAAKSAVHAWSKGLSREVARDGITVNSISPGRLNTEQILQKRHPDPEERKTFADKNIPVGYFGEPEDLACLIVFLASPVSRYITGELIHVDGGMKRFAH